MNEKKDDEKIIIKILSVIGAIIISVVIYFFWVNSHYFEGDLLGMVFQMPLEKTEHYCNRKAHGFLTFDTKAYQACLQESSSESERHNSLINYLMNTFKDDKINKTAITVSQAECMAKKIESKLTDKQIDDFIQGKSIGDQLGAQTGIQILNDMAQCME